MSVKIVLITETQAGRTSVMDCIKEGPACISQRDDPGGTSMYLSLPSVYLRTSVCACSHSGIGHCGM